ncbi:hypothetical protein, partial [Burkholderia cenocepacia]|uniref:hypothetical protein n=1 Tax=Burkholderia cenocepacia TaxID=95486 RepID=UPI00406C54A7
ALRLAALLPPLLAAPPLGARADSRPQSIAAQLPAGYQPLIAHAGPDHDSGRHSFLVVVHRAVDTRDRPSPRPLLIYAEQADRTYRLAARNDQAVLRAHDGRQCDPLDPAAAGDNGLAVKGRYFTVPNVAACGPHCTDYVTLGAGPP